MNFISSISRSQFARFFTSGTLKPIFNTEVKTLQKNKAALNPEFHEYEYLHDEVAARLVDRLGDIYRDFDFAIDLGANGGNIAKQLSGMGNIKELHMLEPARDLLFRNEEKWSKLAVDPDFPVKIVPKVVPIEGKLDYESNSVDLVISSMSLHWCNNLAGTVEEVKRVLKPDGVFMGALLGGETLKELRDSFEIAELTEKQGMSPHVNPMVGIADVGQLISGAGFGIPTIDTDLFTIEYPSPKSLMRHLKYMGENNCLHGSTITGCRQVIQEMEKVYVEKYGNKEEGVIPATFQIIYFIGWKPAPSHPLPLPRGSVPKGFGMRKGSSSESNKE